MRAKVLVVDDSETIRKQIQFCLERQGINTVLAEDGAEGIDIYWKNKDIDLILTDLYMPVIDGIEMIARIKRLGYRGPVVVISQSGENDKIQQAKELGISGWIIKPIGEELLRHSIGKILNLDLQEI